MLAKARPEPQGKPRTIKSVRGLVAALGGVRSAALWACVGESTIRAWIDGDYIPPGWHLRLYLELRRRGREIDPAIFGMPPEAFDISPVQPVTRVRRSS